MSNEGTSKPEKLALTREQLLEALDKDIETIAASQSAAGLNDWAILGALAALLWFALDAWEQGHFILRNVLILTLALTITWDWLKRMAEQLDSSPLAEIQMENRFWSLTGLLGSTRTNIIFDLAKKSFFLAVVFYFKSPFLLWLRICFCMEVVGSLLALAISYWDDLPEISRENKYLPHWAMRGILIFSTVLPASVGVFAWGIVWLNAVGITTHDWRMSLVFSALIYLMSLAVLNRIPTHFLNAYKTIRRNLAYGHISLEDARNQSDIISIGGTLDQTLSPHLKKALNVTERAEIAFHRARQKVMTFADSVAEWANLPDSPETKEKQIKSVKHQQELFDELDKGNELLNKANKLWEKFEARFQHLAATSPEPVKSVESLVGQMKTKTKEMEMSFNQTKELLDLAHQIIKIWKDENTLREKLAKLHEARNNFRK